MQIQNPSTETYVLGQAPEAIQRLLKQGLLLNSFTRQAFEEAGITAGMNVLDLGCGPGDVSLIVAELVGETGSVLGIDTNPGVLQLAQARAKDAGFKQAYFQAGDIRELALDQQYDAIVGRLIVMYLPERAATVRRLAQHLRPGGIVAFQEYDLWNDPSLFYPASPLWQQTGSWITQAFQQAGAELQMGLKLYGTFLEAGLPAPQLRYAAILAGGPESPIYEFYADVVRALLPMLVQFGIATAQDVGIETLADRLRAEIVSHHGVARSPRSSRPGLANRKLLCRGRMNGSQVCSAADAPTCVSGRHEKGYQASKGIRTCVKHLCSRSGSSLLHSTTRPFVSSCSPIPRKPWNGNSV